MNYLTKLRSTNMCVMQRNSERLIYSKTDWFERNIILNSIHSNSHAIQKNTADDTLVIDYDY